MKRNKIKPKYLNAIRVSADNKVSENNKVSNVINGIENKIIKGLISFGLILLLFTWGIVPSVVLAILGVNVDNLSSTAKVICTFINDILFLGILVRIYYKDLKRDFKNYFNNNFKDNLKQAIGYWLMGLGIMVVSNLIIAIVMNGQLTENEEAVRSLIETFPLYMVFQLVIYAPLSEELIFRKSIRNVISNKYVYAIVSGIIFGGLHAISSITSIASLLYLIPYCSLGIVFGLLYYKSNNIFSTMSVHAIHNFLALILYLTGA